MSDCTFGSILRLLLLPFLLSTKNVRSSNCGNVPASQHAENDGDWRHHRERQGFEILPRNGSGKRSGDTLLTARPGEGIAQCKTEEGMRPRDAVATMLKENFGSIVNEDGNAKEWQLGAAR